MSIVASPLACYYPSRSNLEKDLGVNKKGWESEPSNMLNQCLGTLIPCFVLIFNEFWSNFSSKEWNWSPQMHEEKILTCKLTFESTTMGHFPPSSKITGVRCFVAAAITILPTLPLPAQQKIF